MTVVDTVMTDFLVETSDMGFMFYKNRVICSLLLDHTKYGQNNVQQETNLSLTSQSLSQSLSQQLSRYFTDYAWIRRMESCLWRTLRYGQMIKVMSRFLVFWEIGQTTDLKISSINDRSGKLISIVMTVGFFVIILFYFNCMSTNLVVVTKPRVVNNYRDIMSRKNLDLGRLVFFVITYDIKQFKNGSMQHDFW